jgi:spermidine synthase
MKSLNSSNHIVFKEYSLSDHSGIFMNMKELIHSEQSEFQRIDIFDTKDFGRVFALDGVTMTRESDEFIYHEMIAHVPLFLHKNPERILVIGGGDGGTVREVLKHPQVKEVIMCEIDKAVVDNAIKYLPQTSCNLNDKRVTLVYDDGAKFIRKFKDYFDVILIDSTDPTEGQGGLLFTEEFYKNCYDALKEDGVFSAETEDPFIHVDWMKLAFKRIKKVFNYTNLYMGFVPQYIPGTWTWTFASKQTHHIMDFEPEKIKNFSEELKYYNEEIHIASFALPNFVKKIIE